MIEPLASQPALIGQVHDRLISAIAEGVLPPGERFDHRLGVALFAFAGVILVGSVHLGWHYAINGYAGFAIAVIAWWISRMVSRWWETTRWAKDYDKACAALQR